MYELNPLLSVTKHGCPGGTPPIYFGGQLRCFSALPAGLSGMGGPESQSSTGPLPLSIFDPGNKAMALLGGATEVGKVAAWVANLASTGALVYHGYKRNDSVLWAILWGLTGMIWPIPVAGVTLPIAFAQGFAKPKRAKPKLANPISGFRRF